MVFRMKTRSFHPYLCQEYIFPDTSAEGYFSKCSIILCWQCLGNGKCSPEWHSCQAQISVKTDPVWDCCIVLIHIQLLNGVKSLIVFCMYTHGSPPVLQLLAMDLYQLIHADIGSAWLPTMLSFSIHFCIPFYDTYKTWSCRIYYII